MRVLLVTNIPNPYRVPFFNKLDEVFKKNNDELLIAFGTKGRLKRKFLLDYNTIKFNHIYLKSFKLSFLNVQILNLLIYNGILRIIRSQKPDIIVCSGFSIASLKIFIFSFLIGYKYVIWSGTIPTSPEAHSFLRRLFRKPILIKSNGAIAYGTLARDYLIYLGKNPEDIRISFNTVDTYFFSNAVKKQKKNNIDSTIKQLTYVGYLTKRKNVQRLIELVNLLSQQRSDFILNIAGDGPEKDNLIQSAKNFSIQDKIIFHGFLQQQKLPKLFAITDVFLFQTNFDIWGLVLNEAMAAGLTCISSINAGATYDLIKENQNGLSVDFNDINAVAKKIEYLLDNPERRLAIARNASETINNYFSIIKSVESFQTALKYFNENK